jgi:hypothetical protein
MQEIHKLTSCFGNCGVLVEFKTNKRIYCKACRLEKKRAVARVVMAKQRAAKGIAPVKGVTFSCTVCGAPHERAVVHSHRCGKCQAEFTTIRTRLESEKKKTDPAKRSKYNEWHRNKLSEDPAYRVTAHMRTLIHRALGKQKAGRSWRTFVDYSLEELMVHLECQFLPGMTWENKGDWHIDHIIPRASFEYKSPDDESFKQAWALSNLRPIWAIDNIRKNASRMFLL